MQHVRLEEQRTPLHAFAMARPRQQIHAQHGVVKIELHVVRHREIMQLGLHFADQRREFRDPVWRDIGLGQTLRQLQLLLVDDEIGIPVADVIQREAWHNISIDRRRGGGSENFACGYSSATSES